MNRKKVLLKLNVSANGTGILQVFASLPILIIYKLSSHMVQGSFEASGMAIGDTGGDDDVGTGAGVGVGVRVGVRVGVGVEGRELMGEWVAC